MEGLAPQTSDIFEKVTQLECIREYVLVGGTALSLQLQTRNSEDLDFMKWRTSKNEKMEVDWPTIKKELASIGEVEHVEIMDFDHVEFKVSKVKFSFYATERYAPEMKPIILKNNLKLADPEAIGAMKMEVLMRRSNFRDYYDIYSILKNGGNLKKMIDNALKHSGHKLKTKNLIAMLSTSTRFHLDERFAQMQPKYNVSPLDIENYIKELLKGI